MVSDFPFINISNAIPYQCTIINNNSDPTLQLIILILLITVVMLLTVFQFRLRDYYVTKGKTLLSKLQSKH